MGNYGVPATILCMKKGLTHTAKHLKPGNIHHRWVMNQFILKMDNFILKGPRGQNKLLNIKNVTQPEKFETIIKKHYEKNI